MPTPLSGLVEKECSNCKTSKTGICRTHLQEILDRNKDMLLLCKDCSITGCDFKGKYDGVCVFEIVDELDWDKKEKVNMMFHRTLEMERRFAMRQGRLAHASGDSKDFELFDKLISNFYKHTELYGRFKGWYEKPGKFTEKKEAMTIIRKIFSEQHDEIVDGGVDAAVVRVDGDTRD